MMGDTRLVYLNKSALPAESKLIAATAPGRRFGGFGDRLARVVPAGVICPAGAPPGAFFEALGRTMLAPGSEGLEMRAETGHFLH